MGVMSESRRLNIALVLATLVVGLLLTGLGVYQTRQHDLAISRLQFEHLADQLSNEVQRRMNQPVYGLKGARGVYAASKSVERLEFRAYVESRDLPREFPGVFGFGFIQRVPRADLDAFIAAERADDAPDFAVQTSGAAADLYVIKFIDPLGPNRKAQGFDVGSEPIRRTAIERAIRTGEPTLTPRLTLVQDELKRAAVHYLVPVYRNGSHPTTPAEREAASLGVVYAPIVIDEVFAGLLRDTDGMLDVEVFESGQLNRKNLLFDTDKTLVAEDEARAGVPFGGRLLHAITRISIGGQEWTLVMTSTARFEETVERRAPVFIAVGGTLISLLLSGMVFSLGRSRSRAVALAEQMTASLRTSETEASKLAVVASRTSNAVIITDAQARIEWANEGFTRITGYTLAEVRGKTPGSFLQGPQTDPAAVELMRAGLASGEGFTVEILNYGKSGKSYWLAIEALSLRDKGGRVTGFMAIESDISERKAAEQKLLANEQRLTALTTQAPGVIFQFEVSPDGQRSFSFLSAGYRDLFGRDPAEVLKRSAMLLTTVHPEDRRMVHVSLERAISQVAPWEQSFRITRPDGSERWIQARSSVTRSPDGTSLWYGVLADTTEQQQARFAAEELNTKLEAAVVKAEQASVAKSQFLATMSHEIRTPMNGVIGMTSLLLDTPLSGQQREFAEIIRHSGESLLTLINDILDFSKIEAGRFDLENEIFGVRDCMESALDLLSAKAAEKGIDLLYEVAEGVPAEVRGDVTRLRQILVNLLGNALKFTERGEVELTVQALPPDPAAPDQPRTLQFAVRDTGIGIPAEAQGRLFSSFTQVDASTTRKYGGTGLGLAISKRLTELMGGRMWLESEPGRGSTFFFTLRAEWIRTAQSFVSPARVQLRGRHLLVVDDNATNRRILGGLAEKWGMPAILFDRPADALESLRRGEHYDAAILDMHMPEMDGVMLARAIRTLPAGATMPLMLFSSIGRNYAQETPGLFAAVLSKPAKPSQLFDALVNMLSASGAPFAVPAESVAAAPAAPNSIRILLAEDNTVNQKVALHMLARLGCRADVAADGTEVLEALGRSHYDIILMDVQMPEMDGLEATRRIRAAQAPESSGPWIVALTANAMEGDREKCLEAGMDDYLGKPIKANELAAAIARVRPPA